MEQAMQAQATIQARRPLPIPARAIAATVIRNEPRPISAILPQALLGSPDLTGISITYNRNAEIYGEGEPAEYVYKVVSGAVRTYKVLNDGRRQINAFYLPGDVFGLELGDEHSWSAEAIVGSTIAMVKRHLVIKVSERDPGVSRQLWSMTAGELQAARDHALLLIKSARERVVAFLLQMSRRLAGSNAVELPMGRQDIADYLGLTIETVSRTLTQLEEMQTIELPASRTVLLRDRSALSRLNA
jgi:CRP-like cAMP-binding protein